MSTRFIDVRTAEFRSVVHVIWTLSRARKSRACRPRPSLNYCLVVGRGVPPKSIRNVPLTMKERLIRLLFPTPRTRCGHHEARINPSRAASAIAGVRVATRAISAFLPAARSSAMGHRDSRGAGNKRAFPLPQETPDAHPRELPRVPTRTPPPPLFLRFPFVVAGKGADRRRVDSTHDTHYVELVFDEGDAEDDARRRETRTKEE